MSLHPEYVTHRTAVVFGFLFLAWGTIGCEQPNPDADADRPPTAPSEVNDISEIEFKSSAGSVTASADIQNSTIRFADLRSSETGVDFQHVSGNSGEKPFPAANGSGLGIIDIDLDGRPDLYFANGRTFPLDAGDASLSNRIYRNLDDWRFQDVTDETGLGYLGYSVGIAVGDVNSDGFPDTYVTCFGFNQLFLNMGDGTFQPQEIAFGGDFSTSAAFLDFDSDGMTDLYVCNYGKWTLEQNQFCGDRTRNVRIFCSPKSLAPEADRLLRNEGDGTFRDVTAEAGLDEVIGRAQGVLASDVDADGDVDLYVGNDIHPNFLFLNTGSGQFLNAGEISGAAYDRQGQMQAGMGVAGGDINRDGRWDLFVTNFEGEYHTLYVQNSPTDYHDVSMTLGLAAASRPWVGWGTAIADFDLDGWKDLIVTNGHVDDNLQDLGRDGPYEQPGLVWKNDGRRFRFLGESAGDYFHEPHAGRGLGVGDLDSDGDWDVVITHQDQLPALLKNEAGSAGDHSGSVSLRLIGTVSNRNAIGCRVTVIGQSAPQLEQVENGGSYLSAHDSRLLVAVAGSETLTIEIHWPSGIRSVIEDLKPRVQYDIVEPVVDDLTPHVHMSPE